MLLAHLESEADNGHCGSKARGDVLVVPQKSYLFARTLFFQLISMCVPADYSAMR
ncbi:hypothetical protein VSU01S_00400 [Vibrio superstes NBRC 103154]|uniref:Uncharacterized protein n=1 Tax=Vibrio superstes NBRC 103154 TaxID=1219062 RepID=A0A511QKE4_9VIBR|nr:hypothetical protein VSU01S_00400 [Vibrio superstes NBRC 103154]